MGDSRLEQPAGVRRSLQRRIVVSVLFGLAVVLLGIGSLVALAVSQSLEAALSERLAVASAKEHEVTQELQDALDSLARAASTLRAGGGRQYAADDLATLLAALGIFQALAVVNPQGEVVLQVDGAELTGESSEWLPPPVHLRPLLAAGQPTVFRGGDRPVIGFLAPGPGSAAARPWLVAEMAPQRLARHMTAEHSMHGVYEAELLTGEGTVAAGFPRAGLESAHAGLVAELVQGERSGVILHRVPGADHYVAYVPLKVPQGWGVIIEQPRDIVVALPQRLWRWMMGIGLLVLLAGAVVAWADVRRVVMPLRTLATVAERFGRGDLETAVQVNREDEVGLLARTLEEMRTRLKASLEEIGRLSALSERERIARELHDGLAQALGLIYTEARAAEDRATAGQPHRAIEALREIVRLSSQAYEEVRQSIFGLRTMVARRLGLVPALTEYLHDFGERAGLHVEFAVPETFPKLPLDVEAQLIRIVQEALTNVWRHAKATRVWVRFTAEDERLTAVVEDNGIGFDAAAVVAADVRRFGLQAMRERAESVGGSFTVASTPGQGTRVTVTLPIHREG